ncbi:MAG: C4-dicarboxylate family tripartite ATP-independent periplasmic transporter, rane protein [Pseudomonadota bacterium]|jgi:C4-dicarboxylate transporter DctM subunit
MSFLLILAALIAFLYLGMPMFAGMAVFSTAVMWAVKGNLGTVGEIIFNHVNSPLLVALPLFMLMAEFMLKGRLVDDLFETINTMVRHLPGGLAIATIGACTIFAAISGSSVATALTIGAIAIPQMMKYNYSRPTIYGSVAAGGTLGILIPPSGPMILYAFVAETSIGALFMAGVIPGLMLASMFAIWAVLVEKRHEIAQGPAFVRPPRASFGEMARALRKSFWAMSLPPFVLGGMYFGIFTATEAAAIGALLALLIGTLIYRTLGPKEIWQSLQSAVRTSAMLFLIIVAAGLFGHMLIMLRIPQAMVELVTTYNVGPMMFIAIVMVVLFLLGLVLESVSIILITTPILVPVLKHLGIDLIWYGVILTISLEMALISPPVALNLVVIKHLTKAPSHEIDKAATPYMIIMAIAICILIAFPSIATWLPRLMKLGG